MNVRHALVPVYLVLCIFLGGASAAGYLANLLLQFAAITILLLAVLAKAQAAPTRAAFQLAAIAVLGVSLILVQLVPLPPELWTALPGRAGVADGYALLGKPLPWLPLSLAPVSTLSSLFWLLPALAMLAAILRYGGFQPSWIAWALVGSTMASVLLGALQVAGGNYSMAYLYQITNRGFGVGFFSNANHMATLLLMTIPFLAALMATAIAQKRKASMASGLMVVAAMALLVVLVGLLINRSLAGWGLAVPVAAASGLMLLQARRRLPVWAFPVIGVLGVAALTAVLLAPLGNNLTSEEARLSDQSRYTSFSRTIAASGDYMPLGSGVGTFVEIYRSYEDPNEATRHYMNHAHSDYLELLLETGAPGMVLLTAFLLWWIVHALHIWRDADPDVFARAATIASGAVLLHSIVDYPLRTAAISALFAVCVALMARPRPRSRPSHRDKTGTARHLSAD